MDDIPDKVEYLVKGFRNPEDYFALFRNSLLVQKDSHVWFRNKVVTMFDDHDQVRKGNNKARFCADDGADRQVAERAGAECDDARHPVCVLRDRAGLRRQRPVRPVPARDDVRRRVRRVPEPRPALLSRGRPRLSRARRRSCGCGARSWRCAAAASTSGEISGNGIDFGVPRLVGAEIRSVVPWSRIFDETELLLAINTDPRSSAHGVGDDRRTDCTAPGTRFAVFTRPIPPTSARRSRWRRATAKRSS